MPTATKETLEKLAALPHVKKAWINKKGDEYHLTQPKGDEWTEIDVNGGETESDDSKGKKSYAKTNVTDLTALCVEREITIEETDKKADLIAKLEAWDADPNNALN